MKNFYLEVFIKFNRKKKQQVKVINHKFRKSFMFKRIYYKGKHLKIFKTLNKTKGVSQCLDGSFVGLYKALRKWKKNEIKFKAFVVKF